MGRWCSAAIATMRPSYSPRRSVSAARRPASDIPAMTIVFGTIVPSATSATLPVCARAPPGRCGPRARRRYASGAPLVSSEPDANVILANRCPTRTRSCSMPEDRAPDLDVSGRPLRLRDVDLDAFLHPKTIAVIGASEQSAKPNTAMTRKFDAWAKKHGATFYPVHPDVRDRARAHVLRVAGSSSRRARPRDHSHGPGGRHLRGGLAAQGQVRGDLRGRLLRDRERRARNSSSGSSSWSSRATSGCSARTRTSTRSTTSATTSMARRSRSSRSRATRAGRCSRARRSGSG